MKIHILTVCPEMFAGFEKNHVIDRACRLGVLELSVTDIREYADGCFRKVDDSPYGGGRGMILRVQPILDAVQAIVRQDAVQDVPQREKTEKTTAQDALQREKSGTEDALQREAEGTCVAVLSPTGTPYNQEIAAKLAGYGHLILICGHYEGIDARVYHHADLVLSVGDYVLSGGEIPAMAVADSVVRLLPGVLKEGSLAEESFTGGLLEYPQYTRPADYQGEKVPQVLLSGNHEAIRQWRREQSLELTARQRPDLLQAAENADSPVKRY